MLERQLTLRRFDGIPTHEIHSRGTVGVYAPGALGVAVGFGLGTHQFITRAKSRLGAAFTQAQGLRIAGQETPYQVHISNGLVDAYRNGVLPEAIIACPNADQIPGLIDEMAELTHEMAQRGEITVDATDKVHGVNGLPAIIISSNGILDEGIRQGLQEKIASITKDSAISNQIFKAWLDKTIRGTAYVSAERDGSGPDAIYSPSPDGAIVLTGGSESMRARVVELASGKNIRFIDGGEKTKEYEWRKAYTTLMTNVVALLLSYDSRKDAPRLSIPVGRLLSRMKPVNGASYIEVEGAQTYSENLGQAFFAIAKNIGLFGEFSTWQEFNQRIFLDPIRDPKGFYEHIPSSLQKTTNLVRNGQLPDGTPSSEQAIFDALLNQINRDSSLDEYRDSLVGVQDGIAKNISKIKEIYRQPHIGRTEAFSRVFNMTGEIGYISVTPSKIGLMQDEVMRYASLSKDVQPINRTDVLLPMSAEVFTYGPEEIPGNVAYITNGAGFTLKALDRATEAGVRLGFISDLRVDFTEGKYYLAMKMALAANPHINTIAIDVFTTLGTSTDVAKAIQRIYAERPDIQFVVKVEGRNQREGMQIFQSLTDQGAQIIFSRHQVAESTPESTLTFDDMIRSLRKFDGMPVDSPYELLYGEIPLTEVQQKIERSLHARTTYLLNAQPFSGDTEQTLEFLRTRDMISPQAVFGNEFKPAVAAEKLKGAPVVVIAGYGATARLQAKLMRSAGTEVVLLHPQIHEKVNPSELQELDKPGISIYSAPAKLQQDLEESYQASVDVIGVCYEPYKPEVDVDGTYKERIEETVRQLVSLKTQHGLQVRSILIPTEMVPTAGTKNILNMCREAGIWFIGPNSPGMSKTSKRYEKEHLKLAQIPPQTMMSGNVAVAGVGGTMLFETLFELKTKNIGSSWAISLGGDRTRGLSARDAALIAENDPDVKYFVYIGETGGNGAQELAEIIKHGLTKPVIAMVIGERLPNNCHIGHAGAVTHGLSYETAGRKIQELRGAGAIIVHSPSQIAQAINIMEQTPRLGVIDTNAQSFKTARILMKSAHEINQTAINTALNF